MRERVDWYDVPFDLALPENIGVWLCRRMERGGLDLGSGLAGALAAVRSATQMLPVLGAIATARQLVPKIALPPNRPIASPP